jgi:hypothetical protein
MDLRRYALHMVSIGVMWPRLDPHEVPKRFYLASRTSSAKAGNTWAYRSCFKCVYPMSSVIVLCWITRVDWFWFWLRIYTWKSSGFLWTGLGGRPAMPQRMRASELPKFRGERKISNAMWLRHVRRSAKKFYLPAKRPMIPMHRFCPEDSDVFQDQDMSTPPLANLTFLLTRRQDQAGSHSWSRRRGVDGTSQSTPVGCLCRLP